MRAHDENDGAFALAGNLPRAATPDLPEEDGNDGGPPEHEQIVEHARGERAAPMEDHRETVREESGEAEEGRGEEEAKAAEGRRDEDAEDFDWGRQGRVSCLQRRRQQVGALLRPRRSWLVSTSDLRVGEVTDDRRGGLGMAGGERVPAAGGGVAGEERGSRSNRSRVVGDFGSVGGASPA